MLGRLNEILHNKRSASISFYYTLFLEESVGGILPTATGTGESPFPEVSR